MKKHTKKHNKKHGKKTFKIFFGGDSKPLELLLAAAKDGNAEQVYSLYRKLRKNYSTPNAVFIKINNTDDRGFNALRHAYERRNIRAFNTLLNIGAIDVPDINGKTILQRAIENKQIDIIHKLLNKNATNVTDDDFQLALRIFQPTGIENIDSLPENNIVKLLSRKLFHQGRMPVLSPLIERPIEKDPGIVIEGMDVHRFKENEEIKADETDNPEGYERNANGQIVPIAGTEGAWYGVGSIYSYPLEVPIAKPLRSRAWELWREADPEASSVLSGASYRNAFKNFFTDASERFQQIWRKPVELEDDDEILTTQNIGRSPSAVNEIVEDDFAQGILGAQEELPVAPPVQAFVKEPVIAKKITYLKEDGLPVQKAIRFGGKTKKNKKLKQKNKRSKKNKVNKK